MRYSKNLVNLFSKLFFSYKTDQGLSPVAPFNPSYALSDKNAFSPTSTPADTLKAKTLILTKPFKQAADVTPRELIAWIAWLVAQHIPIYLCYKTENQNVEFFKVDHTVLEQRNGKLKFLLNRLTNFDPTIHYDILAKQHKIARDKTLIAEKEESAILKDLFTKHVKLHWGGTGEELAKKYLLKINKYPNDLILSTSDINKTSPENIQFFFEKHIEEHFSKEKLESSSQISPLKFYFKQFINIIKYNPTVIPALIKQIDLKYGEKFKEKSISVLKNINDNPTSDNKSFIKLHRKISEHLLIDSNFLSDDTMMSFFELMLDKFHLMDIDDFLYYLNHYANTPGLKIYLQNIVETYITEQHPNEEILNKIYNSYGEAGENKQSKEELIDLFFELGKRNPPYLIVAYSLTSNKHKKNKILNGIKNININFEKCMRLIALSKNELDLKKILLEKLKNINIIEWELDCSTTEILNSSDLETKEVLLNKIKNFNFIYNKLGDHQIKLIAEITESSLPQGKFYHNKTLAIDAIKKLSEIVSKGFKNSFVLERFIKTFAPKFFHNSKKEYLFVFYDAYFESKGAYQALVFKAILGSFKNSSELDIFDYFINRYGEQHIKNKDEAFSFIYSFSNNKFLFDKFLTYLNKRGISINENKDEGKNLSGCGTLFYYYVTDLKNYSVIKTVHDFLIYIDLFLNFREKESQLPPVELIKYCKEKFTQEEILTSCFSDEKQSLAINFLLEQNIIVTPKIIDKSTYLLSILIGLRRYRTIIEHCPAHDLKIFDDYFFIGAYRQCKGNAALENKLLSYLLSHEINFSRGQLKVFLSLIDDINVKKNFISKYTVLFHEELKKLAANRNGINKLFIQALKMPILKLHNTLEKNNFFEERGKDNIDFLLNVVDIFQGDVLPSLITSLELDADNPSTLITLKEKKLDLSYCVTITLFGENVSNLNEILKSISENFPRLQYLTLNINCDQSQIHIPNSLSGITTVSLGWTTQEIKKIIEIVCDKNNKKFNSAVNEASSLSLEITPYLESTTFDTTAPKPNSLYVNKKSTSSVVNGGNVQKAVFTLSEAGEALNPTPGEALPRIRTKILDIEFNYENNTINTSPYTPKELNPITQPKQLTEQDIQEYQQADSNLTRYYKFKSIIQPGEKIQLYSIDPNDDKLTGISTQSQADQLKFFRGDDDFYYVVNQGKDAITLDYVIQTSTLNKQEYRAKNLPKNNISTNIITAFKTDDKYSTLALASAPSLKNHLKKSPTNTIHTWLLDIYTSRQGSCEERCVAVLHKIKRVAPEIIQNNELRLVHIDGNHTRLELRQGNNWYTADLGGKNADIKYEVITQNQALPSQNIQSHTTKENKQPQSIATDKNPQPNNQAKTNNQKAYDQTKAQLLKSIQIQSIYKLASLEKALTDPTCKHILLIDSTSTRNRTLNRLITSLNHQKEAPAPSCYFVDSEHDLDRGRKRLRLEPNDTNDTNNTFQATIQSTGALATFLSAAEKAAKTHPTQPFILFINWDELSPKARVQCNSLLDKGTRQLQGFSVPDNVRIVGCCQKKPDDTSFLSRHQAIFNTESLITHTQADFMSDDTTELKAPIPVDLQGFPNWEQALFGPIVLKANKSIWEPSPFIKALLHYAKKTEVTANRQTHPHHTDHTDHTHFIIKNISAEQRQEIEQTLARASAVGYLNYYGQRIPLSPEIMIHCSDESFDFNALKNTGKNTRVTLSQPYDVNTAPKDAILINTHLFDQLLSRHTIDEQGHYQEYDGLIKAAAKHNPAILPIWITSDLSLSQWYCLIYQAHQYQVQLTLYLAPEVQVPDAVATAFPVTQNKITTATEDLSSKKQNASPCVTVSTQPRYVHPADIDPSNTRETEPDSMEPLIIAVEDYSWADLLEYVGYQVTDQNEFSFSKKTSALLTELANGRTVILQGQFSPFLLQILQPLMRDAKTYCKTQFNITITGELKFWIQDTTLTPNQTSVPELAWLGTHHYQIDATPIKKEKPKNYVAYKEENNFNPDQITLDTLDNAQEAAEKFIKTRIATLKNALKDYPVVILVGNTGVGKSALIRALEADDTNQYSVNRGFNGITAWLERDPLNPDKVHILFFDETNTINRELTSFEGLFKENGYCLHEGELYPLGKTAAHASTSEPSTPHASTSEQQQIPSHLFRFVGAMNPVEDGGLRQLQKLLTNYPIAELHLADFPPTYIYAFILKPIFDVFKAKMQSSTENQEAAFKEQCVAWLKMYYTKKTESINSMTVRDLQEQALSYCFNHLVMPEQLRFFRHASAIHDGAQASPDNITGHKTTLFAQPQQPRILPLPSHRKLRLELRNFLHKRDACHQARQQSQAGRLAAWGLNAFFLAGPPGIGKSQLVVDVLSQQGYKPLTLSELQALAKTGTVIGHQSNSTPQQRYFVLSASLSMSEKKVICEQAAQTGIVLVMDELDSWMADAEDWLNELTTGPNSQLTLIATGNGIGFSGRDMTAATERRLKIHTMTHPTPADFEMMIRAQLTKERVDQIDINGMADALATLVRKEPGINLRNVIEKISEIAGNWDLTKSTSQERSDNDLESKPTNLETGKTEVTKIPSETTTSTEPLAKNS